MIYILSRYFGLLGIVGGYVVSSLIETIIIFNIVNRLVGSIARPFLMNIIKPVSFCLAMVAVIALYQRFIGNDGIVDIIAQVVIGGLIYGGLTLKFKISIKEILSLRQSL